MEIQTIDLMQKFSLFSDPWHPRIVGELNGSYVKIARLKGDFVWHQHEHEDEMFFVVKGRLTIKLRDRTLEIAAGQFVIIPMGVEHLPVAEQEVLVLLLEPTTTINTGNAQSDRTVSSEWI